MNVGSISLNIRADLHGALADTRIGAVRRTLGLWLLAVAIRLLRSRVDVSLHQVNE